MTKQLNRRDAMKRGGAALVATAAMMGTAAATSDVSDEGLRDLWWRFIEAELRMAEACIAEDEASFRVRNEAHALVCPWTPVGLHDWDLVKAESSDRHTLIETMKVGTVKQQDGVGPWLVKEYQPASSPHPAPLYTGNSSVRWQPYPEASTADEAYAMATARADKEWRSLRGKLGAIERKHRHRALEAAVEAGNDASRDIRLAIAQAPTTGPLAVAVKLAAWADWNVMPETIDPDEGRLDMIDGGGLGSVYAWAVEACGFDPIAAIK
jgi:hypothetical protein